MMTMMSHLFCVSVVYCGRCQYGESPPFCIVEPHAPRFVTAYLAGSSIACSCAGYVIVGPLEWAPAVMLSPTHPICGDRV